MGGTQPALCGFYSLAETPWESEKAHRLWVKPIANLNPGPALTVIYGSH